MNTDKRNLQIPFKIVEVKLNKSRLGVNGRRAGKITIRSYSGTYSFDIITEEGLEHQYFGKCNMILHKFLSDKIIVK